MLQDTEMDFKKAIAGNSVTERITNNTIREIVDVKRTIIVDDIKQPL